MIVLLSMAIDAQNPDFTPLFSKPEAEPTPMQDILQQAQVQRLILQSAKDYAIFTMDPQRRITSWNAGAQTMFIYTESEIIGQLSDILFTPEDQAAGAPQGEAQKAIREGQAENERWHVRKDGSQLYGSGMTTPLREPAGTIIGLVKVMRNLTQQKQAEEALAQSEERLRIFVSASSDIVYRMSADWQHMEYLVGKEFLVSTQTVNSSWLQHYIPPEDQPSVQAVIQAAIRQKCLFELEHRVILADGTVGWTFSRAIPVLGEQGEIQEWFGAASNITARKQAEEALRLADRRKDEFLPCSVTSCATPCRRCTIPYCCSN